MKKAVVMLCLILTFSAIAFIGWKSLSQPKTEAQTVVELPVLDGEKLFGLVQKYRYDHYLAPFKKSDFLCEIADQRLVETHKNWSHEEFKAARFCEGCTLGENISKDFYTEEANLQGWLNSTSHKAQIESKFTHSCLKCDKDNYCVEIFGYY